jgi:hypothetical protein
MQNITLTYPKIAYEESNKAKEIDESLAVLLQHIRRIRLTADIPKHIVGQPYDAVQDAALDLCAAVMEYLAVAIRQLRRRLVGTPLS